MIGLLRLNAQRLLYSGEKRYHSARTGRRRMKEKKFQGWVVLTIMIVVLVVGVFVWQFPKTSSEWAAWVQAFGSIAAIVGAVYVGYSQTKITHHNNIRLAQIEEQGRRSCYFEVFDFLQYNLTGLQEDFYDSDVDGYCKVWRELGPTLIACLKAANSIPIHDLGGTSNVVTGMLLISVSEQVVALSDQLVVNQGSSDGFSLEREKYLMDALDHCFSDADECWAGAT